MSSYHRGFEFRVPPTHGQRHGQYISAASGTQLVIGQPVTADFSQADDVSYGLQPVVAATGAQAPVPGASGIVVYEFKRPDGFAGFDVELMTYADLALIPFGAAVMVIAGPPITVGFRNVVDTGPFLNTRDYPTRIMVAGVSIATPTVAKGSYLTPGVGTDAAGYWQVTSDVTKAWLLVTDIDTSRGEVEARCLFSN